MTNASTVGESVRPVATRAELVEASGGDLYVRSSLPLRAEVTGWRAGSGVAWYSRSRRRGGAGWLVVVAAAQQVPALVAAAVADTAGAVTGATLPAGALPLLPAELRPVEYNLWDWFWTASPPPRQPSEDAVTWAGEADDAGIVALLDAHSPRHSARPGEPEVRRWCVLRDGASAELLACAAHIEYVSGVPHLASIVTRTDHRGRGLGAGVTAWLTRQLLAEAPVVTLGMYGDNDTARRMYRRLGYTDSHHWASGPFPAAADQPLTHDH